MAKQSSKTPKEIKSDKSDQEFEYICIEIENGEPLRRACKAFMSTKKFYELLDSSEEKRKRYARACEERAESIFDEIIDISNESNADLIITEKGGLVVDGEAVSRSRLKIDARKWVLSKLAPKKYGDKLDLTSDGEKIQSHVTIFQLPDNGRG